MRNRLLNLLPLNGRRLNPLPLNGPPNPQPASRPSPRAARPRRPAPVPSPRSSVRLLRALLLLRSSPDSVFLCARAITLRAAAGESAWLCTCGESAVYPLCDGSHKAFNAANGTKFAPLQYKNQKEEEVTACSCRARRCLLVPALLNHPTPFSPPSFQTFVRVRKQKIRAAIVMGLTGRKLRFKKEPTCYTTDVFACITHTSISSACAAPAAPPSLRRRRARHPQHARQRRRLLLERRALPGALKDAR